MTAAIQIKTKKLRGHSCIPLYCQYSKGTELQPAYVQMGEGGDVLADYSGEIGGSVPASVWHNRTLRWSVSPGANGDSLADLLQSDEVQELLTRVFDGHTVEWDGSNHVGRLSDDAKAASETLSEIFAPDSGRYVVMDVWDAYDWICESFSLAELVKAGSVAACASGYCDAVDAQTGAIFGDMEQAVATRSEELINRSIETLDDGDDVVNNAINILVEYGAGYVWLKNHYTEEFGSGSQPG